MRTLHWSPDTGMWYWNKDGGLSEPFESREIAMENKDNIKEYPLGQVKNWIRLSMDYETAE